jgi:cytochrome c-type biogenesis protein CcmI
MVFWIVTGAMALGVSALLVLALLRGRADEEPPAAYDLRVYRDQLKEVDRDLARGIIGEGEAERLRTEVSRRLLAADAQVQAAQAGETKRGPAGYVVGGLVLASLLGGSLWIYAQLGAPGYPDLALADRIAAAEERRQTRPTQAEAEAEAPPMAPPVAVPDNFADLVQRLRGAVAERPGDLQGHILLARNEAALGNFTAAYKAQEQVLNLKGETATASDYADYGDMMVLAAGGYVSPKAESAFREALAREPSNALS